MWHLYEYMQVSIKHHKTLFYRHSFFAPENQNLFEILMYPSANHTHLLSSV